MVKAKPAAVDPGDLQHRDEHSVEFQAVFLRHVLGETPFSLVPVLCGSPLGALSGNVSRAAFLELAKCHFKTTDDVLGPLGKTRAGEGLPPAPVHTVFVPRRAST